MIYSPARWMQAHLINQGIGSNPDVEPLDAWPIYLALLPDEGVDNAICLYDTPGMKDGRTMPDGKTIVHPGLMVVARATYHDDAYDRISQLALAFDAVKRTLITIGDQSIVMASVTQRPIHNVGVVGGDRPRSEFLINATISFA